MKVAWHFRKRKRIPELWNLTFTRISIKISLETTLKRFFMKIYCIECDVITFKNFTKTTFFFIFSKFLALKKLTVRATCVCNILFLCCEWNTLLITVNYFQWFLAAKTGERGEGQPDKRKGGEKSLISLHFAATSYPPPSKFN